MLTSARAPSSTVRARARTRPAHAGQPYWGTPHHPGRKACACGGACPRCAEASRLQAKLNVGASNDESEREADQVADRVVVGGTRPSQDRGPAPDAVQRMSLDDEHEDEDAAVQRQSPSGPETDLPPRAESYIRSLRGGGAPLSAAEARYFEPRFGRSFAAVRVHTGPAADEAARSIDARAFTFGNAIAFARGQRDFGSASGRWLMAHELAHTVQQAAGPTTVQRGSAGLLGGKCCSRAARVEWALVGNGVWKKLEQGDCTGTTEDCDGMTCGGGFYHVDNLQTGTCRTPRTDDATFAPRRWTPTSAGPRARSPTAEGSTSGDTPPNYHYDSASTAACPNGVRTISVDLIQLAGSTISPAAQLATANTVFGGCCVRFVAGATPPQESQGTTETWLGGDTELKWNDRCAGVDAEEKAMFDTASIKYNLTSRMRIFFVATINPATALAYSSPPFCATGEEAPYVNHAVITNRALSDTLAHEFGHILLDSGAHTGIDNPADTGNLMFAPGRTASNLDATQCATIFQNA